MLIAIVALTSWLQQTTDAIERPQTPAPAPTLLDFRLVEQRYDEVGWFSSRERVEGLLGPPTQRNVWEPGFVQWEKEAANSNRDFGLPMLRVWDKWIDQRDKGKWVLIFFAGDKVYYKVKNGF